MCLRFLVATAASYLKQSGKAGSGKAPDGVYLPLLMRKWHPSVSCRGADCGTAMDRLRLWGKEVPGADLKDGSSLERGCGQRHKPLRKYSMQWRPFKHRKMGWVTTGNIIVAVLRRVQDGFPVVPEGGASQADLKKIKRSGLVGWYLGKRGFLPIRMV